MLGKKAGTLAVLGSLGILSVLFTNASASQSRVTVKSTCLTTAPCLRYTPTEMPALKQLLQAKGDLIAQSNANSSTKASEENDLRSHAPYFASHTADMEDARFYSDYADYMAKVRSYLSKTQASVTQKGSSNYTQPQASRRLKEMLFLVDLLRSVQLKSSAPSSAVKATLTSNEVQNFRSWVKPLCSADSRFTSVYGNTQQLTFNIPTETKAACGLASIFDPSLIGKYDWPSDAYNTIAYNLDTQVAEGEWPESPRYQATILQIIYHFAKAANRNTNADDLFAKVNLQAMVSWFIVHSTPLQKAFVNTQSQPQPLYAFHGDSNFFENPGDLFLYADELARVNTALAAKLAWHYDRLNQPELLATRSFEVLAILPGQRSNFKLHSEVSIASGSALLRTGSSRGVDEEAIFMHTGFNSAIAAGNHPQQDAGAFNIVAKGYPLVMNSQTGEYQTQGAALACLASSKNGMTFGPLTADGMLSNWTGQSLDCNKRMSGTIESFYRSNPISHVHLDLQGTGKNAGFLGSYTAGGNYRSTSHKRHVAFIKNPGYFVVWDSAVASSSTLAAFHLQTLEHDLRSLSVNGQPGSAWGRAVSKNSSMIATDNKVAGFSVSNPSDVSIPALDVSVLLPLSAEIHDAGATDGQTNIFTQTSVELKHLYLVDAGPANTQKDFVVVFYPRATGDGFISSTLTHHDGNSIGIDVTMPTGKQHLEMDSAGHVSFTSP